MQTLYRKTANFNLFFFTFFYAKNIDILNTKLHLMDWVNRCLGLIEIRVKHKSYFGTHDIIYILYQKISYVSLLYQFNSKNGLSEKR